MPLICETDRVAVTEDLDAGAVPLLETSEQCEAWAAEQARKRAEAEELSSTGALERMERLLASVQGAEAESLAKARRFRRERDRLNVASLCLAELAGGLVRENGLRGVESHKRSQVCLAVTLADELLAELDRTAPAGA